MTPKEECEVLLKALLPTVEDLLEKHGGFYPAGAVLTPDDGVQMTMASDGSEFPDSNVVLKLLIDGHRKSAREDGIKASGIVWNGSFLTGGKTKDAILVSLEHRDGYSVIVGRPYQIGVFKKVKFEDLIAIPGKHDIFNTCL